MTGGDGAADREFFFLPGSKGPLFAVFHTPRHGTPKGGILFVPPFAEELNRSRRIVSQQAHALACRGYCVLLVDLYGCGDSDGEFRDSDWTLWLDDLALAFDWLSQKVAPGAVALWALRLGALLAAELAERVDTRRLVLWQPMLSGDNAITELLRVFVAGQMLRPRTSTSDTRELRRRLQEGESLEIAGYELTPRIADAICAASLDAHRPTNCEVHWLEVGFDERSEMRPASSKVLEAWREDGIVVFSRVVAGTRFWGATDSRHCPALIEATVEALTGGSR